MPTNKTIPQLTAQLPQLSDLLVGDDGITTYKFLESQLITFMSANLSVGAILTFGTAAIPSNTVGKNGDVYVKTDTGQFAQRLSGVWTVVYTIIQGVVGSIIYYGSTVPDNANGINGDTYLRTTNGVFYHKETGAWVAKFSMATGPVGPAGAAGANGTNGTDGNTILYGSTNPSNLSTGVNGNFYINTSTNVFFGPKAGGIWPAGVALSFGQPDEIYTIITGGATSNPLTIIYDSAVYPSAKYALLRNADNSFDWNTKVQQIYAPVSGSPYFTITGDDDGTGHFADSFIFIIKP